MKNLIKEARITIRIVTTSKAVTIAIIETIIGITIGIAKTAKMIDLLDETTGIGMIEIKGIKREGILSDAIVDTTRRREAKEEVGDTGMPIGMEIVGVTIAKETGKENLITKEMGIGNLIMKEIRDVMK